MGRPPCDELDLTLERRQLGLRGIDPRELRESHLVEGAADRLIEPLPHAPDAAGLLDFALSVPCRAVRERERTLERIENRRGADLARRPGELVAAAQPRVELTRPARCSCFSSLLTVGAAMCVCSESAVAVCTRAGSPASVARITVA